MENHHAINKVNHLFRLGPSIPLLCLLVITRWYFTKSSVLFGRWNANVAPGCWQPPTVGHGWTHHGCNVQPAALERPKRPPFETASPWRHRVCLPFINCWNMLKHWGSGSSTEVNMLSIRSRFRKAVLRKALPVGTWNVLFWNLRNLHWCPGTLCCFPLHISSWTSFCGSKCARWKGKTSMKGHLPFFSSIAHQITCATHVLLGIGCCSEPLLGSTSSMSFR